MHITSPLIGRHLTGGEGQTKSGTGISPTGGPQFRLSHDAHAWHRMLPWAALRPVGPLWRRSAALAAEPPALARLLPAGPQQAQQGGQLPVLVPARPRGGGGAGGRRRWNGRGVEMLSGLPVSTEEAALVCNECPPPGRLSSSSGLVRE